MAERMVEVNQQRVEITIRDHPEWPSEGRNIMGVTLPMPNGYDNHDAERWGQTIRKSIATVIDGFIPPRDNPALRHRIIQAADIVQATNGAGKQHVAHVRAAEGPSTRRDRRAKRERRPCSWLCQN